ncbi:MAG: glycosyltransferase [Minwuia sp.]|nr:glycosyltransferase [Minwuia sp.]
MAAPMIVFGEDWGAHPSSTQHLMARLAADREVLWVNSIGLRRPRLNAGDARRLVRKVASMFRKGEATTALTPPEGISVASAKAVSWPGSRLARRINRRTIPASLKPFTDRFGPDRPIFWTSLPSAVDVIGQFNEAVVIYYAGDDFEGLAGVDHKPVGEMERELADRADLIIAASSTLAAKFPQVKTVILPHGCDLERFGTPVPRAPDLPSDRPVAGFYGSLADWLDYDLLRDAAVGCPEWDFVFIGNVSTDLRKLSRLTALPNVRLMGPRPHEALPSYVQHWQASLLPFVDNAQIRACNPLKLREYLAAGTPVVATAFPALSPYRDHVRTVATASELTVALKAALSDLPPTRAARQASVADESWDARAQDLKRLIDRAAA